MIQPEAPDHVMQFELAGKSALGQRHEVHCACGWVSEATITKQQAEILAAEHASLNEWPACWACLGSGRSDGGTQICHTCAGRGRIQ